MGTHVDGLKFAGGSFSLFQEKPLRELLELAHEHGVYVSTVCWTPSIFTWALANPVIRVVGPNIFSHTQTPMRSLINTLPSART